MKKSKLLVIVGPTASGKSALAVQLAKRFNGEIISADSRQVYRGLDIGTGKITKKEMRGVPHHLLDVASPKKAFTAHDFISRAEREIARTDRSGKLAIIVGGTGFYIDALLGRISLPDVAPDSKLRARLQKKSAAQLYAFLKQRDPRRARTMNTLSERNNKVRLIRALEVAAAKSPHVRKKSSSLESLWLGVQPNQKQLEQRILERLRVRIQDGMVAEGKKLHANGLSFKRMEQLGLEYRSLSRLLQKKLSRKEFEEELFRDIRRYAKKQLAYWKRNRDITWFSPKERTTIEKQVRKWLTK